MKALKLAGSLIRIPHLAASLFVFPLFLSLVLVIGQLVITAVFLNAAKAKTTETALISSKTEDYSIARRILYGEGNRRPALKVCRWTTDLASGKEVPASADCQPDRLDVALRTAEPLHYKTADYEHLFEGMIDRLHVCTSCDPDIVINVDDKSNVESTASSVFGLMVLTLPYENTQIKEQKIKFIRNINDVTGLLGNMSFTVPELQSGIGLSELKTALPVTLNITFLVVIALWLALRAHRKVLDYFSQNNVLMPLVAACGKRRFYMAIWLLTAARVLCFLGASIPIVYFGLNEVSDVNAFASLTVSSSQFIMWLVALISSLALATILASVSELKHRQSVLSFAYKFVPIAFALLGAAVWAASFIFLGEQSSIVRMIITVLPIVGMAPMFVAPILNVPVYMMTIHAAASLVMITIALRQNARWFAAHLEEV